MSFDDNNRDSERPPQDETDGVAAQDNISGEGEDVALDADLRKLQEERDNLLNQVARVQADFRNARARLESEKQQQIQYANATLIKSLLPAIDNFERALEVNPAKADVPALVKGMRIVHDQLMKVLGDQKVEAIAPQPGTPFDPGLHEALMQQPSDEYSEPTVTQLLQKGYSLHGRILRPAQVAVSKTS